MAGYTSDRIIDRILEHHSNKIIDNYSNFEIKKPGLKRERVGA
jgi:hypothetical protein